MYLLGMRGSGWYSIFMGAAFIISYLCFVVERLDKIRLD
jgi:hypothetical protein